jgi:hypothetical protein
MKTFLENLQTTLFDRRVRDCTSQSSLKNIYIEDDETIGKSVFVESAIENKYFKISNPTSKEITLAIQFLEKYKIQLFETNEKVCV